MAVLGHSILKEYMDLGLSSGKLVESPVHAYSFCGNCGKRHSKKWFEAQTANASFYFCQVGGLKVVVEDGKKNFKTYNVMEFMSKFPLGRSGIWSNESEVLVRLKEIGKRVVKSVDFEMSPSGPVVRVSPGKLFDQPGASATPSRPAN